MMDPALYAAAGLLVGVLVGLTGIGGGSFMTPILVFAFGQSPTVAVGTDLIFASATKLVATVSLGLARRIDWQVVARLAIGSLPAALVVVAWMSLTRRPSAEIDHMVLRALGVMLVCTGVVLLFQQQIRRLGLRATAATLARAERWQPVATVFAGILLGFAVTLTSVGAGAIGTVLLLYLYPLRLTASRLVATDVAHALPLTLVAGVGHASLGHVNLAILGSLLLGSIPGVLLGSRLAIRLPEAVVRSLIALMLLLSGARILAG
jgi:uncharacterized membrane protein YfcA